MAFAVGVLVLALVLATTPLAAGKGKGKPKAKGPLPDLKIREFKEVGVGDPAYVLVHPTGTVPSLSFRLITTNIGKAVAPASKTLIQIETEAEPISILVPVKKLKPGRSDSTLVSVDKRVKSLGIAKVSAEANPERRFEESNHKNNRAEARDLTLLAQEWTVSEFKSFVVTPAGPRDETAADPVGFDFVFNRYDPQSEDYKWIAEGEIKSTLSGKWASVCTVKGEASDSKSLWSGPDDGLSMSKNLNTYLAQVAAGMEEKEFDATITCPWGPVPPSKDKYKTLVTLVGAGEQATMEPDEKTLSGSGEFHGDNEAWSFHADIP